MSEVHEKMKKKDIHLFWLGSLVGLGRENHDDGPFAKRVLLFLTGCDLRGSLSLRVQLRDARENRLISCVLCEMLIMPGFVPFHLFFTGQQRTKPCVEMIILRLFKTQTTSYWS